MQIILLERIANLGQMGDEVRVRDGFARNFLLRQGKALRANEANRKHFEAGRAQLEARNLERQSEAVGIAERLSGQAFIMVRQAAETGHLYGSVTPRDLAEAITEAGFSVNRGQVELAHPIKAIGLHDVSIRLHPDVAANITANVARSSDEAERQARGEDLTGGGREAEEDEDVVDTTDEDTAAPEGLGEPVDEPAAEDVADD
jgi:large subunit ribosomal protein L9